MRTTVGGVEKTLDRLQAAVDAMQRENVACQRNLMVFRARMDSAERVVARMSATLQQSVDVLGEAEAEARCAADTFRATVEGRPAQ